MAAPWKILLTRSGGFAGLSQTYSIDASQLSDADAQHLDRLVSAIDFRGLEQRKPGPGAPDRFQYHLQATRGSETHDLLVSEPDLPPKLSELLDWLTALPQQTKA